MSMNNDKVVWSLITSYFFIDTYIDRNFHYQIHTHMSKLQDYDYELLNHKWNENSHHNSKAADAIKPISGVALRGTT